MYTNLTEGLTAMVVGLGTVFSFLVILMIVVVIMGKIILKLNEIFPEQIKTAKAVVNQVCDDAEIAAAIAAAKYRN